jgi:hypothetical protein
MKNDWITMQDVINEDEIVEQAARHNVWLKKLDEYTPGWPVYSFRGTKESLVAFLLDAYGRDMDDPEVDVLGELMKFKNAPAEYTEVHGYEGPSPDTVIISTDGPTKG